MTRQSHAKRTLLLALLLITAHSAFARAQPPPQGLARPEAPRLTTLALRVHHMAKMEAFYAEAFGFTFRDEVTGDLRSRFGVVDGLTIKLVPIRKETDFVDFPVHQPGFEVDDVNRVIAIARKHGGVLLQPPPREAGRIIASVRDPDGNTIELYERARR